MMMKESRGGRRLGRRIFDRLRQAWEEYQRDYAFFFAPAMVYHALVSLVPLLLLLLSALGLMLRYSEFANYAEQQVLNTLEMRFGAELPKAIGDMLDGLRQGSIVTSIISLIGLLLAASALFKNLRLSFRAIWKHEPPLAARSFRVMVRKTFLEQAISFAMVVTSGLLFVLSMALVSIVQWLGGFFGSVSILADTASWFVALVGPLVTVTVIFAGLFKFLPPVRVQWRHVLLPAVFSGVGWYITAEIVALYGLFFGGDVNAYGALGGLLIIILWMNVISQLLFFGAELSKVLASSEPLAGAA